MSKYTIEYLANNVLVNRKLHGDAWWKYGDNTGVENHFDGPVPIEEVQRRLFPWEPIGLDIRMVVPDGTNVPTDVADKLVEAGFIIPDFKAWVRGDTFEVMGIHSSEYVGHNYNVTLIDRVREIVNGELVIASAGLLDDGAEAWVEVSVPDWMKGPDGIDFRPYLMATDSLNGSIPTTYIEAIVLAVCDNTRAMVLGNRAARNYRVKHTKNSEFRLMDAATALGLIENMEKAHREELDTLLTQKVTPKQVNKFWDTYTVGKGKMAKNPFKVPEPDVAKREGSGESIILNKKAITLAEKARDSIIWTYNHDERCAPWKGTAFGVLNTINTYDQHESRVNEGTVRLERNMRRAATGYYDQLDRSAYEQLQAVLS